MDLALLFHLNQPLSAYCQVADHVAYGPLLRTLRNHQDLPFHLEISGTLLADLAWRGSQSLVMIEQGLRDNQFELLGTAFAQPVLMALDPPSRRLQVQMHQRAMQGLFGQRPQGFWNPGGVWDPELLPLLVAAGYRWLTLDKRIFQSQDLPLSPLRVGPQGELILFPHEVRGLHCLRLALFAGIHEPLLELIEEHRDHPGPLVLSLEAEAVGLRGFERGQHPGPVAQNLDRLLDRLAGLEGVRLCHLTSLTKDAPWPHRPQGMAAGEPPWIMEGLRPGLAKERRFTRWSEFKARATRVAKYSRMFSTLVSRLAQEGLSSPALERLGELGELASVTHQYEFGHPGATGLDHPPYDSLQQINILFEAMGRAREEGVTDGFERRDFNGDGVEEALIRQGPFIYVFSLGQGSLIHLFDLRHGREVVGSLAVPQAMGRWCHPGDYPISLDCPTPMGLGAPKGKQVAKPWYFSLIAPHLRRLLPQRSTHHSMVKRRPTRLYQPQRAFYDVIHLGSRQLLGPAIASATLGEIHPDRLSFLQQGQGVAIEKTYYIGEETVEAKYRIFSPTPMTRLRFRTTVGLSAPLGDLLRQGTSLGRVFATGSFIAVGHKEGEIHISSNDRKMRIRTEEGLLEQVVVLERTLEGTHMEFNICLSLAPT